MVAVIKTSKSLRNVLHYNENKLKNKVAKLIHSEEFAKDTDQLNLLDKLRTFEKRHTLNSNIKLNTVHISLNFHGSDKLTDDKMKAIACDYMRRIGFGGQPFLVYRHFDAGHEHLHIVSTTIRADGSGIRMYNIGKKQSTAARIAIEKNFKLRPATAKQLNQVEEIKPVTAQKVQYGKMETKRAITNVLDHVLPKYKYSSLGELNAVLKLYNVTADPGAKDSRIQKNGGLIYRVLDNKGQKTGVPIKASLIYNKPTLQFLEQKFIKNTPLKQGYKSHLKNSIDSILMQKTGVVSLDKFTDQLKRHGIDIILRQNSSGRLYGITYVDHKTRCVFNGSALGKAYAANGLLQRLAQIIAPIKQTIQTQKVATTLQLQNTPLTPLKVGPILNLSSIAKEAFLLKTLDILTTEEFTGSLSLELQRNIKKRKRKKQRPAY